MTLFLGILFIVICIWLVCFMFEVNDLKCPYCSNFNIKIIEETDEYIKYKCLLCNKTFILG